MVERANAPDRRAYLLASRSRRVRFGAGKFRSLIRRRSAVMRCRLS
jgi:hypothetical protein